MDFVTIVENKPIYNWQIELLIESFKKFNLQDNLYIYLIGNKELLFKKNLQNYKNCFYLEDKSLKYGYHHFSFYEALKQYREKNPNKDFCLINPDQIIVNNDFSFFNNKNIYYQSEIVKSQIVEDVLFSLLGSKVQQICSLFYFSKEISSVFFSNSFIYAEKFLTEVLKIDKNEFDKNSFNLFYYGLLINTLMENKIVETSYETIGFPQTNTSNFMFLSYKFDILPFFKKSNFTFERNDLILFNSSDPFENLATLPDFPNCIPLRNIAVSYRDKK